MNQDTHDFLIALLFGYHDEEFFGKYEPRDFSQHFIDAAESFVTGFREYLEERDIPVPEDERTFGGNVYFSLSGHGVGFWDDRTTGHLQAHLEAYSGDKYRFEQIDLTEWCGKLDLSFLPEFLDEQRTKLFTPATRA